MLQFLIEDVKIAIRDTKDLFWDAGWHEVFRSIIGLFVVAIFFALLYLFAIMFPNM
jgi:hypothetical protein